MSKGSDKAESPVNKKSEDLSEIKQELSPNAVKIPSGYRGSPSGSKYIKDSSSNFRRNAGIRRESPRYVEPVRKCGSREPGYTEGYRRESPSVRMDYNKKVTSYERNDSVDRRNHAVKVVGTPVKDSGNKLSDYYKDSPTIRPRNRGEDEAEKEPEGLGMADLDIDPSKTYPQAFETILKYYGQEDIKKPKDVYAAKPPARKK